MFNKILTIMLMANCLKMLNSKVCCFLAHWSHYYPNFIGNFDVTVVQTSKP